MVYASFTSMLLGLTTHFTRRSSFWQNNTLKRNSLVQEIISWYRTRSIVQWYLHIYRTLQNFLHTTKYWLFQCMIYNVKRCTWWEIVVLVTALRHKSYTFWPTYHMLIAYTYYTKWQFWTINYSAHTLFCCLGAVVAVIVW
jgi:hypothetical protein